MNLKTQELFIPKTHVTDIRTETWDGQSWTGYEFVEKRTAIVLTEEELQQEKDNYLKKFLEYYEFPPCVLEHFKMYLEYHHKEDIANQK